jgi:hypothetical protein
MLRRAIAGLERMPDRYRYAELRRARAEEPYTLPEVRAAFEGVEEGYARLGPYTRDEPLMPVRGEKTAAYSQLCQEVYHQGPEIAERYFDILERWSRERPASDIVDAPEVTWHGIFRLLVRGSLSAMTITMFLGIPRDYYLDDPLGTKALVWDRIPRMILLFDDFCRDYVCNWWGNAFLEKGIPLLNEVYHHPSTGPRCRRDLERSFSGDILDGILAPRPEPPRPVPWRHEEP